jgi:hypothetical protein
MSWAVDRAWEPGENLATCLAPARRRCDSAPGVDCMCGLWALWSLNRCLTKAADDQTERLTAIGLIEGWGTVALHGDEGFRAERARVICLFEDWVWRPRDQEAPPRRGWLWLAALLRGELEPPRPDPARSLDLAMAAQRYGVPLVSLRRALEVGLLSELGLSRPGIAEVRAWVAPAA